MATASNVVAGVATTDTNQPRLSSGTPLAKCPLSAELLRQNCVTTQFNFLLHLSHAQIWVKLAGGKKFEINIVLLSFIIGLGAIAPVICFLQSSPRPALFSISLCLQHLKSEAMPSKKSTGCYERHGHGIFFPAFGVKGTCIFRGDGKVD